MAVKRQAVAAQILPARHAHAHGVGSGTLAPRQRTSKSVFSSCALESACALGASTRCSWPAAWMRLTSLSLYNGPGGEGAARQASNTWAGGQRLRGAGMAVRTLGAATQTHQALLKDMSVLSRLGNAPLAAA